MLHYIDCNAAFVNSTDIMESVMPDGLHPNHVGMGLLAQVSQNQSSHCNSPHPRGLGFTSLKHELACLAASVGKCLSMMLSRHE